MIVDGRHAPFRPRLPVARAGHAFLPLGGSVRLRPRISTAERREERALGGARIRSGDGRARQRRLEEGQRQPVRRGQRPDFGQERGAYLTLSMRTLSNRNLCEEFDEDTCRVTVSEHEHATIHAIVKLSSEDEVGEHSVGKGSLVRVVGKLTDEVDPDDGASLLRVGYYRHWPRHFFVTTSMASGMTK